jgi:ubiquinol-cytochrome c reductase iron-sulfur subunit
MSGSAATLGHGHAAEVTKRDFLKLVTGAGAAIGGAAFAGTLIDSMNPSQDVLALSAVEVDLSKIAQGSGITARWQGKPIFVRHRTPEEIQAAQGVPISGRVRHGPAPANLALPPYAFDTDTKIKIG